MTYITYTITTMKFIDATEALKEDLKDPVFKKEWDALEVEFDIISAVFRKRVEKDMTQAALARKMRTNQAVISRLESGTLNPSVKFLKRLAKALDTKLKISLV